MYANVALNKDGELELIPDWAESINNKQEIVPGAQLCTKDGRRTGNAHVVECNYIKYDGGWEGFVFGIITDAGSAMRMTANEIHSQFYIGTYISKVEDVLAKFDREKHFEKEPV